MPDVDPFDASLAMGGESKYNALNMVNLADPDIPRSAQRLEIRAFPGQKRAEDVVDLLSFMESLNAAGEREIYGPWPERASDVIEEIKRMYGGPAGARIAAYRKQPRFVYEGKDFSRSPFDPISDQQPEWATGRPYLR
jgi:hypothetical protein